MINFDTLNKAGCVRNFLPVKKLVQLEKSKSMKMTDVRSATAKFGVKIVA